MLLYTENGPTVLNSIHVASAQIIPAAKPGSGSIDHFELHFIVSGGKIVHILPDNYTKKLSTYFMNPASVRKLSRALLEVWTEVSAEPSPRVAISFEELVDRIIEKT